MKKLIGRISDNGYTFYFYSIHFINSSDFYYSFRYFYKSSPTLVFEFPYVYCDLKSCLIASYCIANICFDLFNPDNQLGLKSFSSAPDYDLK